MYHIVHLYRPVSDHMNICQLIRSWIHIDLSRSPVRNDNHSHVHVDTCIYKYITGYFVISVLVYVIITVICGW